jgi:hypothetical protein
MKSLSVRTVHVEFETAMAHVNLITKPDVLFETIPDRVAQPERFFRDVRSEQTDSQARPVLFEAQSTPRLPLGVYCGHDARGHQGDENHRSEHAAFS